MAFAAAERLATGVLHAENMKWSLTSRRSSPYLRGSLVCPALLRGRGASAFRKRKWPPPLKRWRPFAFTLQLRPQVISCHIGRIRTPDLGCRGLGAIGFVHEFAGDGVLHFRTQVLVGDGAGRRYAVSGSGAGLCCVAFLKEPIQMSSNPSSVQLASTSHGKSMCASGKYERVRSSV